MRLLAFILKGLVVVGLLMSVPASAGASRDVAPVAEAAISSVSHAGADHAAAPAPPCLNGHCPGEESRADCPANLACGPVFLVAAGVVLAAVPSAARGAFAEAPRLTVALIGADPPPPRGPTRTA